MRIAIFTESCEPIVNGVSVSVATLRDALRARGHEVFIFAPHFPGYQDTEGVLRFPSRTSRFARGYPIPVPYAPRLRRAFLDLRPDIVHTQTPFFLGVVGLRWARAAGIPVVSTNHTLYAKYAHYLPFVPRAVTRAVLVRLMQWYYGRCDAIVVPSRSADQVLRQYGIKTRIEVIRTGVAVGRTGDREATRHRFAIPDESFVLLYVGRIAREKNVGLLLRAFRAVHERHPEARLMIVGSGPYEQASRRLSETLQIGDDVLFTGMLSREEISEVYGGADAFVFPSVTETQGLVVCEALTAGLPCVAVRAAGIPEVIEDGVDGFLTENSADGFAESISRLISDPDLRNRLSEGALRNSEKFSTRIMAERFEAFYQSVIEQVAPAASGQPVGAGG